MSTDQKASKARHSKLRASCDTCFLAKVKCSKARPVCSRCLTCGTDCIYSPSSRAGKPKSDGGQGCQPYAPADMSLQGDLNRSSVAYTTRSMNVDADYSSYTTETDWSPTPTSTNERAEGNSRLSAIMPTHRADESFTERENTGTNAELFDPSFLWMNTPRTDMTLDSSLATSLAPWLEGETNASNSASPGLGPGSNAYLSNTMAKAPSCNCFKTCLQALEALHNNTSSTTSVPSFDVVLTVNRKAVDGCAMMLNCPICLSQSNSSITTTMLLGTIIGKIMAIYQDASKNYFGLTPGQAQPLPLTFGTYRVAGDDGRWLEMEIIMRELRKLKVLFAKFQETSSAGGCEEDAGMHGAVTNYLCQSLHLTFEVLNIQKNSNTYG